MEKTLILKTLVGSQAHGLANQDSDFDYRGVFIVPTQDLLKIGPKVKTTSWIEGKEDDVSHEIGEFLGLALSSNPAVLEVFNSPVVEATPLGHAMLLLFPKVWTPKNAVESFTGYSRNQRIKFFDDKLPPSRKRKFAVAYLRSLWQCRELLKTNAVPMFVHDWDFKCRLLEIKYATDDEIRSPEFIAGIVRDATVLQDEIAYQFERRDDKAREPDTDAVNDFLIKARQGNWS